MGRYCRATFVLGTGREACQLLRCSQSPLCSILQVSGGGEYSRIGLSLLLVLIFGTLFSLDVSENILMIIVKMKYTYIQVAGRRHFYPDKCNHNTV